MQDDFDKKNSELLNDDDWNGFLGIKRGTRFYTKAGISSLYSEVYFLEDVPDEHLHELPDYVLSDTLQKDLDSSVSVCLMELQKTKYLPEKMKIATQFGALPDGEREGVWVSDWEDYNIISVTETPLYDAEMIEAAIGSGEFPFSSALRLIVKDICDAGDFLSAEWYCARIAREYFCEYPLSTNNAYLIGELFKEFCVKQQYEGDLSSYYQELQNVKQRQEKGKASTKSKAEELREYCVELFAKMAKSQGARLMMAPPEVQAEELKAAAIKERPQGFMRAGKPYSKEWFLRNIIEDRKLDIVETVERLRGE